MKIRPVGAEFCADRQTDRHDEALRTFSRFCERTKKTITALVLINDENENCVGWFYMYLNEILN